VSAVATRPGSEVAARRPQAEQVAPTLFERDRVTLEDVVLRVWEDLALEGAAECPVCGASMAPAGCQSCGSELE
jgi:tRNA(Ile2) C34 agmatinyltransferase TiaS